MSAEQIAGAIVFFLTVSGVLWGIWWRIEGRVEKAKSDAIGTAAAAAAKAELALLQLAEHRLHVAETYVSKAGHREATEQIMDAINGVGARLDRVNERLDRAFEQNKPSPRGRGA